MEADPRVDPGRVCARRSDDEVYAAANSLRQEAAGYRRAVEHSARQLVYNTLGLKRRNEVAIGDGNKGGLGANSGRFPGIPGAGRGRQRGLRT